LIEEPVLINENKEPRLERDLVDEICTYSQLTPQYLFAGGISSANAVYIDKMPNVRLNTNLAS
jgi:hypothetical protein